MPVRRSSSLAASDTRTKLPDSGPNAVPGTTATRRSVMSRETKSVSAILAPRMSIIV